MHISIDASDLNKLAATLDEAAQVAPAEARKVVQKGALNVKTDARRRIGTPPHLPRYAASITYDTAETTTGASAEIGPDKDKTQGPLGNVLEYGSVGRAPVPHLGPALEAEAPKFERALEDLAVRVLGL